MLLGDYNKVLVRLLNAEATEELSGRLLPAATGGTKAQPEAGGQQVSRHPAGDYAGSIPPISVLAFTHLLHFLQL